MNRHCFWRGGVRVPSIITHKISSRQVWISGCPTSRGGGGVLIAVTVAISIGGGGYPGEVPLRKSACWPASLLPVWCITCA